MVESGQFINKHGVAILFNKRWKNQIKWVHCESERIVAMSISVNKHPIVLMSVYMPHSGYADHHVEKVYRTITKIIEGEKGMKIIGGDFNAELGPGEGLELSAVGHYTLNKGNCRGEWMTQWLLQNKMVALKTMFKKKPEKQVTYHTSKEVKNSWTTSCQIRNITNGAEMPKRVIQFTWEAITDVLRPGSKSRMTRKRQTSKGQGATDRAEERKMRRRKTTEILGHRTKGQRGGFKANHQRIDERGERCECSSSDARGESR